MAKRKTSESVRKTRLIILGLSAALVIAVIIATWYTLSKQSEDGSFQWNVTSSTSTSEKVAGETDENNNSTDSTTSNITTTTGVDGLPYDKRGSDVFADWDGKYTVADVVLKQSDDGTWYAYVLDKKVKDCTGVYCNEYGWYFVRDGKVDWEYTGIAGNNVGQWYIKEGKLNWDYNGTFNPYDGTTHYTVIGGQVVNVSHIN